MWILKDLFKWRKLKEKVSLDIGRALMIIRGSKIDVFRVEDTRIEEENNSVTISLGIKLDLENLPLKRIRIYFRGFRTNKNPLFTHWKVEEEIEIDRKEAKKHSFNLYIPKINEKNIIKQKYQEIANILVEHLVKASKARRIKTKLGYLWDFKVELARKQLEKGDVLWYIKCSECRYLSIILRPSNECPWCGGKLVECKKVRVNDLETVEN